MTHVPKLEAYALRAQTVEPVFAWIKQNDGLRRWSFRGLDKLNTQRKMVCTSLNLRAIFRKWLEKRPHPARIVLKVDLIGGNVPYFADYLHFWAPK